MSKHILPLLIPAMWVAATISLQAQPMRTGNALAALLPDAPVPAAAMASTSKGPGGDRGASDPRTSPRHSAPRPAPRLAKYIQPNQQAMPLSATDKLQLSLWEQVQPFAFGSEVAAAAWEHLIDSDPQYGSDKAGFGERLGAAAIRQTSQSFFSDGVVPALLHQDPRYYRKGSGGIKGRVLYAASRVLVIRTDAGRAAPNYSQLIGYAGASALTMTYYPAVSATWPRTAQGYVLSLLTSMLGNQIHEFSPDAIRLVFHRHRE